jgi:hypothetical protein
LGVSGVRARGQAQELERTTTELINPAGKLTTPARKLASLLDPLSLYLRAAPGQHCSPSEGRCGRGCSCAPTQGHEGKWPGRRERGLSGDGIMAPRRKPLQRSYSRALCSSHPYPASVRYSCTGRVQTQISRVPQRHWSAGAGTLTSTSLQRSLVERGTKRWSPGGAERKLLSEPRSQRAGGVR